MAVRFFSLGVYCGRHVPFKLVGMSSSETPRNLSAACTHFLRRQRGPCDQDQGLGISHKTTLRFLYGGSDLGALLPFAFATTCQLARPPVGADRAFILPTRTFTSGLPTDWSPAPSPDMTTVASEQFPSAGLSPASLLYLKCLY